MTCHRVILSPNWLVADLICHRFNCHQYGLSPIWPVSPFLGHNCTTQHLERTTHQSAWKPHIIRRSPQWTLLIKDWNKQAVLCIVTITYLNKASPASTLVLSRSGFLTHLTNPFDRLAMTQLPLHVPVRTLRQPRSTQSMDPWLALDTLESLLLAWHNLVSNVGS